MGNNDSATPAGPAMSPKRSSSLLALTGLLAMVAQVWLVVATGNAGSARAAVLLVGVGAAVWALAGRAKRAGDLERLFVVLAATAAFWVGALEIVLRQTVPMARGLLVLLTLAAIHAALLYAVVGSEPRGGLGRAARGLLASLAVLLGTLTLMEAAVRAVSPIRSYELVPDDPAAGPCLLRAPDGRLVGVPGCSGRYVHRDFPGLRVELNDLGLRDGLDEVAPPDDATPSVLVLGDSFAYGMGVELGETFQQVAQERLSERLGPVRVFGAAVPGAGTGHEHAVLEELGELASPDVVVLALFEGNDMQDHQAALARRHEPGPAQRPEPMSPWRYLASTLRYPFWRTSSSLLQLRRIDGRPTLVLQKAMLEEPDPSIEPLREAMLEELEAIQATTRELDAELLVLVIPGRVQIDPASFETFAARHPERRFDRRAFHEGLVADIRALGIPVIDPLPRLEREAAAGTITYHDEGHWNRDGHRIAAELLVEALEPRLMTSTGTAESR